LNDDQLTKTPLLVKMSKMRIKSPFLPKPDSKTHIRFQSFIMKDLEATTVTKKRCEHQRPLFLACAATFSLLPSKARTVHLA
jgi:hypothetical protein